MTREEALQNPKVFEGLLRAIQSLQQIADTLDYLGIPGEAVPILLSIVEKLKEQAKTLPLFDGFLPLVAVQAQFPEMPTFDIERDHRFAVTAAYPGKTFEILADSAKTITSIACIIALIALEPDPLLKDIESIIRSLAEVVKKVQEPPPGGLEFLNDL